MATNIDFSLFTFHFSLYFLPLHRKPSKGRSFMTVSTAESCTGGRIASAITARSGASRYFVGGLVAYQKEVKEQMLGVPAELIERYGTIQDALAAYNYGEQGAKQHLWKKGIYVYDYNQTIMNRMKEIEEELEQDAGD